jgi:putative hemolysin
VFLLGMRASEEPPVTEDEIKAMMQQGVEAGVFVESEHSMVEGVFRLGERRVSSMMTRRPDVTWINLNDDPAVIQSCIINSTLSRFPVGEGDLDHVLGIVHAKDLLNQNLKGKGLDVRSALKEGVFVPESMLATQALEVMREKGEQMLLVMGEYGGLQGLATLQDMLEQIVGNMAEDKVEPVQREDGSWLLDGIIPIDEMKKRLDMEEALPGEGNYETLGGFIMTELGRIPALGDHFEWTRFRFEVIDMDDLRVDKVLVSIKPPEEAETTPEVVPEEALVDTEVD